MVNAGKTIIGKDSRFSSASGVEVSKKETIAVVEGEKRDKNNPQNDASTKDGQVAKNPLVLKK